MLTVNPEFTQIEEPSLPTDSPELIAALKNRKRRDLGVNLTAQERSMLAERIVQDFFDASSTNQGFRKKHVEYLNNWLGTPEEIDPEQHPLGELAANVKVPLTTTYIEQWKARLSKIILGEGNIATFYSEIATLDQGVLKKIADWFNWELYNVVKIDRVLNSICHYLLVDGISLSLPEYVITKKQVVSTREFELDPNLPISVQIEGGIIQAFSALGYTVEGIELTTKLGVYSVDLERADKLAEVRVLLDDGALVFELEYEETVFDGVKVKIPNIEDVVVLNTGECIEELPFVGIRSYISVGEFQERFERGEFIIDKTDLETIIATAGPKSPEFVGNDNTREQDVHEGSDSTGETYAIGNDDERLWIELYRWEGVVQQGKHRVGVCALVAGSAKILLKCTRLEELNKDGKRTCVKHEFIPIPGRFYALGMCALMQHSQTEIDGVHNFRLNSALVATVPFGFYEPTAGAPHTIVKLRPGDMYPVKKVDGILFPRLNWSSVWSFNEEQLIRDYAAELAGMGDSGTGSFNSKRTSASEFLGTTQALDIRTEHIARTILADVQELLYRIFALYQQHAKNPRAYMIAGKDGSELIEKLEPDLLQGRLKLQLTGSIRQLSRQLEQEKATQMLSLLLNEFAIQLGIVRPDTVYHAMAKVMDAAEYTGVPIYKPQHEPDSPAPEDEVAMFNAGVYTPPHIGEDFGMHLQAHMELAASPKLTQVLTPEGILLFQRHVQETAAMYQQVMMLRQQQAIQAQAMQQQFATMGIRPGEAGATSPGQAANAGTKQEGVTAAEASDVAT